MREIDAWTDGNTATYTDAGARWSTYGFACRQWKYLSLNRPDSDGSSGYKKQPRRRRVFADRLCRQACFVYSEITRSKGGAARFAERDAPVRSCRVLLPSLTAQRGTIGKRARITNSEKCKRFSPRRERENGDGFVGRKRATRRWERGNDGPCWWESKGRG